MVDTFDTPTRPFVAGANLSDVSNGISGSAFTARRLFAVGSGFWTVGIAGGSLNYDVTLRSTPEASTYLVLDYALLLGQTPLNLLGTTHLVLHVTSLSG